MHPSATFAVSALLATAVATGVTFALRPGEPAPGQVSVADLQQTLDELRKEHTALRNRFETLANAPQPVASPAAAERSAAPSLSTEQVGAAVEAYLQQRGAGPGGAALAASAGAFDLDTEFARLQGTSFWEDGALWKRLFAAGKMDEAIKQFEALAKANPGDTKVQMDLANAYLAYLQMDQSKWQLSMKADQVFDKVLDLDERHWEARFSKAMSYTFWPDFLGKKKDAISHFETLVAQQEAMPAQPHEAQTYLFLGNLLEARDPAKAKATWAKGARRHPENAELAKKGGS